MAQRADHLGCRERGLAGARSQVEHLVAALEPCQVEHGICDGTKPGLKGGRPAMPGRSWVLPLQAGGFFERDRVEVLPHIQNRVRLGGGGGSLNPLPTASFVLERRALPPKLPPKVAARGQDYVG